MVLGSDLLGVRRVRFCRVLRIFVAIINFVAIDFETANNFRSSACSIVMAKVENGRSPKHFTDYLIVGDEEYQL